MIRLFASVALALVPLTTIDAQYSDDSYTPRKVLPVPMKAITNPAILPGKEAEIADNELVIGVRINGEARAYPINQRTGPTREIINDTLGGTAIAATW